VIVVVVFVTDTTFAVAVVTTGVPVADVVVPSEYVVTVTGVVVVVVVTGVVVVTVSTVCLVAANPLRVSTGVVDAVVTTGVPLTDDDVTVGVPGAVPTIVGPDDVGGVTPSISQLDVQPGTTPAVPPPAPLLTAVAPAVNVDGPNM
jgi:hypothetical protein